MRELLSLPAANEISYSGAQTADHRITPVIISRIGGRDDDKDSFAAVAVDDLEGYRETLVRGLGRHATRWRGVTGATEMSDGTVALALDLPSLLKMRL